MRHTIYMICDVLKSLHQVNGLRAKYLKDHLSWTCLKTSRSHLNICHSMHSMLSQKYTPHVFNHSPSINEKWNRNFKKSNQRENASEILISKVWLCSPLLCVITFLPRWPRGVCDYLCLILPVMSLQVWGMFRCFKNLVGGCKHRKLWRLPFMCPTALHCFF